MVRRRTRAPVARREPALDVRSRTGGIPSQESTMQDTLDSDIARGVRDHVHPLHGTPADYDPLLEMVGEAPFVLLGEGSHGTHEFYAARAHITERLIVEKGFTAVAVEADWPDAYR